MVYVRNGGTEPCKPCEPRELAGDDRTVKISANSLISFTAEGPFVRLSEALERDDLLRDHFAHTLPVPSLIAWGRLRYVVLGLAAVPLLIVLELDRELVGRELLGTGRFIVDLLLTVSVVFELTRRTPRAPAVAAAALLAVAMRWLLVVARLCGAHVHAAVWTAAGLALACAITILARAPSRKRQALELLAKVGVYRADVLAARSADPTPSRTLVVAAALTAAGMPLLLWGLRRSGAGLWLQAFAFIGYALVGPAFVRRVTNGGAAAGPRVPVVATIVATTVGLTITAALIHGSHQFFDAGAELARCTGRLDEASRRLLGAEAAELSRRVAAIRGSTALVLMTTAVMPLAEERIYRGLLMDVLVRRYGANFGLLVSAFAFGLAHVGIYEIALYQTVLLGVGFGIAYAEGGLLAAFTVHAIWNLLNVA